jgi:molybdopterin biosynthesis enzyme
MVVDQHLYQRIARLTPLSEVLAFLNARVARCAERTLSLHGACGKTLTQDIVAQRSSPQRNIALRDGWALQSELTSDANSYAPAMLPDSPRRVDAGDAMPDGTDCVAPFDVVETRNGRAQMLAPIAPNEGMLPAGADAAAGMLLRRSGEVLRASDIAVLSALGIGKVRVAAPRIRIAAAGRNDDPIIAAIVAMLTAAAHAAGDDVSHAETLEHALQAQDCDAVIAVGGTGGGRNDASIVTLARIGSVAFHGIGLMPGETAAVGMVAMRPVLLVPGRIDAALACWLALGAPTMRRLSGNTQAGRSTIATLSRKITSTIGIVDAVPVRRDGDTAEPLAGNYWPMHAIARANGFVMVAAESEGYPAGARVETICWPDMWPEARS